MTELTVEYTTEATAAQRAEGELAGLHDALALAVGRLSGLSPEAASALGEALALVAMDLPTYRLRLASALDDARAAQVVAAGRVDAALTKGGLA